MSHKPLYKKRDWLADCQACGKTFYASELKKRWDGFMVCSKDYEIRHPQDFVRGIADTQAPPWTAPAPTATFTAVAAVPVAIITLGNPFQI